MYTCLTAATLFLSCEPPQPQAKMAISRHDLFQLSGTLTWGLVISLDRKCTHTTLLPVRAKFSPEQRERLDDSLSLPSILSSRPYTEGPISFRTAAQTRPNAAKAGVGLPDLTLYTRSLLVPFCCGYRSPGARKLARQSEQCDHSTYHSRVCRLFAYHC